MDGVGELQPFVGGGVGCLDGEVDIQCAAGLAGGAGTEDAHFAHAREAAEGAKEHGEILVTESGRLHAFSPIREFGFYAPCC